MVNRTFKYEIRYSKTKSMALLSSVYRYNGEIQVSTAFRHGNIYIYTHTYKHITYVIKMNIEH
jgi:hypothetical protein